MLDLHSDESAFLDSLLDELGGSGPGSAAINRIKDGTLLRDILDREAQSDSWNLFPLNDLDLHWAFIFVNFCVSVDVPVALIPDAFELVAGSASDRVVAVIKWLRENPSSRSVVSHSGPTTDDSESACTCLMCRWRQTLTVMTPLSHAWAPDRLPHSVRRLVEQGIPRAVREHVWLVFSGGLHLLRTRRPSYVALFPRALEPSANLELIDLDISRTYQDRPSWRLRGLDVPTRRVLAAYSLRNQTIGYCQGLSYIVGVLVSVVNEEIAFAILCAMIEDGLIPPDYYTTLQGAVIDRHVLDRLLHRLLPDLVSALGDHMDDYSFISIPWNMCLFSTAFEMNVSIRVWDLLFTMGPSVLFRVSLGLLRELQTELVVNRLPIAKIRDKIKFLESTTTESDIVLYVSQFPECTNELIQTLREEARIASNSPASCYMSVMEDPISDSIRVCDDEYFGPPDGRVTATPAQQPMNEARRRREAHKGVIDGLSRFMNGW